jgi:hypothetical protein
MRELRGQLRFLMISNVASWGLVAFLCVNGLAKAEARPARFQEIDVERINVMGTDGRPVLVIANRRLIPGPTMNGKEYPRALADGREFLSGMIFFNEQGDEVGGLIFNGIKKEQGYSAVGHLSFDQWKQNQVVALQYVDTGSSRRAGLSVWDRPTDVQFVKQLERGARMLNATPEERAILRREADTEAVRGDLGAQRVFVGSRDATAQVQLSDPQGHVRARLSVDSHGAAVLEFLDEHGGITAQYPPQPIRQQ